MTPLRFVPVTTTGVATYVGPLVTLSETMVGAGGLTIASLSAATVALEPDGVTTVTS